MAKIKQVAKYDGSSWGTPYDLGADAENIDVVTGEDPTTQEEITDNLQNVIDNIKGNISTIQTNLGNKVNTSDLGGFDFTKTYLETTGNSGTTIVSGISQNNDTSPDIESQAQAVAGESTLTLWNKFNKFVKRVSNKFGEYTTTANLNTLLANKVSKTGDSMTGSLLFRDFDVSNPSNYSGYGIGFRDHNDHLIGRAYPFLTEANLQGIGLEGRNVSGKINRLNLCLNNNNDRLNQFTGNNNGYVTINVPNMDSTASTLDVSDEQIGSFGITDKNGQYVSWLDTYQGSTATTRIALAVRNQAITPSVTNAIYLGVQSDGTRNVSVSAPAAWRNAIGVKLSTMTLSNLTTNGSGEVHSDSLTTSNAIVLATTGATSSYHLCVPFVYNNVWYFRVLNKDTGAAVKSTNIGSITVYYIAL